MCYIVYTILEDSGMAGRTVSAYTDETTAQRIAQLAKVEDRSPAEIAAAALRLYVNLPTHAHQAFRAPTQPARCSPSAGRA